MPRANSRPSPLLTRLVVRALTPGATTGRLTAGATTIRCALGRAGRRADKREGDGATPYGVFRLLRAHLRADRVGALACRLPRRHIRRDDGWCDDSRAPTYNRPVRLPFRFSHEEMWRQDELYDVVIVLDWNIAPRRKDRGSAIFFHCARPDYAPTAGCVAISGADMRRLLPRLARDVVMDIR